jgi:hypothetical protein
VEEEEVGEVGDVVVPGGSGSSHGRLRSSRRTVLPRAASLLLPSFTPFSSGGSVWVVRGTPLGRLGLGELRGSRWQLLIAAGGAVARGRPGCAGGRGARRDGEATAGAPCFSFGRQPKG